MMSFDERLNIWRLPSAPPGGAMAQCKPCDTWYFEALCAESTTPDLIYVSALAMTSIDGCVDFEIESTACPGTKCAQVSRSLRQRPRSQSKKSFWCMCISRRLCSCTARTATAEQTYLYNRSHTTTATNFVTCTLGGQCVFIE